MGNNLLLAQVLAQQMHNPYNYLFLKNSLLNLGELKYDGDESGKVAFCVDGDGVAVLEAREGDVYDVLVQEEMLRLFIGENDHERLDECITQFVVLLSEL